jgi:antitoxin HicB
MIDDVENGTVGSSFDDFLKEQGTYEATVDQAVKRVLAFQLEQEMKAQGINKVVMAQKLQTSRSQLDRVLDPKNESVSLSLLTRAAQALGRKLHLELQ